MSNLRFYIVVLFMCVAGSSISQAPGYLGKRLFVEGNLGVNIGLDLLGASELNNDEAPVDFQVYRPTSKISLNYVISRYRYIAIDAEYSQFSTTQDSLFRFAGQPSLQYRIRSQSIGIGFFKTARKKTKSLAPLGFYFGYKFAFMRSYASPIRYANSNEKFQAVEKAAYNLNYRKPELNFFRIAISSGYRTILKDKFTLSYAIDLGYNFPLEDNTFIEEENRPYAFSLNDLKRNNSLYINFTVGGGILLY